MTDIGPSSEGRPLVTFALFAYNQEKYVREAVEGAFLQTYEPLEIILSDDCSSDRTFEIMQEMASAYCGPHLVVLRRNETNFGLGPHVNAVLEQSRGEIVLVAAGDDVSLPERTEISVDIFERNVDATAVLLSADVTDQTSRIIGQRFIGRSRKTESSQTIQDLLKWHHVTFGATRAIRKEIFTKFGPFRTDCPTEDTPLLLRTLICGRNILSHRKGIRYRIHENNLSGTASFAKMNIGAIYQQYLDDIIKSEAMGLVTKRSANSLLRWMQSDQMARQLRLKITLPGRLSLKECVFVLRHPSFCVRDKVKAMAKCILPFSVGKR